jgi:hypothetical protein
MYSFNHGRWRYIFLLTSLKHHRWYQGTYTIYHSQSSSARRCVHMSFFFWNISSTAMIKRIHVFQFEKVLKSLHIHMLKLMKTVSMLASNVVDHGCEPRSDQTNNYKIGICCFSAKTGWLGIRIMYQNGETCLSTNCCFSEQAL